MRGTEDARGAEVTTAEAVAYKREAPVKGAEGTRIQRDEDISVARPGIPRPHWCRSSCVRARVVSYRHLGEASQLKTAAARYACGVVAQAVSLLDRHHGLDVGEHVGEVVVAADEEAADG